MGSSQKYKMQKLRSQLGFGVPAGARTRRARSARALSSDGRRRNGLQPPLHGLLGRRRPRAPAQRGGVDAPQRRAQHLAHRRLALRGRHRAHMRALVPPRTRRRRPTSRASRIGQREIRREGMEASAMPSAKTPTLAYTHTNPAHTPATMFQPGCGRHSTRSGVRRRSSPCIVITGGAIGGRRGWPGCACNRPSPCALCRTPRRSCTQ